MSAIVDNALALNASFAAALGCRTHEDHGVAAIDAECPGHRRAIVVAPCLDTAEAVAGLRSFFSPKGAWVLEDPFGSFDGESAGLVRADTTVLFRYDPRPGEVLDPGLTLRRVDDRTDLEIAERIVAEGFEQPELAAAPPGSLYPRTILDDSAVSILLAVVAGEPAATVMSYHDGRSTGLYWGATLHTMRRRGLCGGLIKALMNEHPHTPTLGSSGAMSQSRFREFGYRELGPSTWWLWPGDG
ncbi:hypothetical protein [Streptomyces sp. NL15-2K]|uniref:hypothetical protein n=1 Tax=Streptomyces sp. NL15-2K TaxID=376149 RepID=UPI000F568350|nr:MULTISPECIES: hypothetical protein [Actinomycetes]WKX10506.1 hypothetical protein Q4V64_24565 [Kutzneria buriramensis]